MSIRGNAHQGLGYFSYFVGTHPSDKHLGEVLKALEDKKILAKTDVMVVSDHGFSTIPKTPAVAEILKRQKFKAFKGIHSCPGQNRPHARA